MKRSLTKKYIIGIDEVGRGALAGPVVVAAVMLPARRSAIAAILRRADLGTLKDSKKLTAAQREAWTDYFRGQGDVRFAIARVYPRGIERLNISAAANHAAERAFERIIKERGIASGAGTDSVQIFLDGGLFLGSRARQTALQKQAKTLVKADETIAAVAAASIIAKVARDRFMKKLAVRHPRYSFDVHKGYGTARHRAALEKYGPCDAHRLTFLHGRPMIKR